MSFKTFTKILPVVINSIKGSNQLYNRPLLVQFSRPANATNLCNYINTKQHSTRPHQEIRRIYYGVLTPQIKAVKIFSLSSSIVGIIGQPFLYSAIVSTGNVPIIVAAYSFIGFFTFLTPLLLHLITRKYVTELKYNEEKQTYIATTVNILCMAKETEFKPEDVVVPNVPGMLTSFIVKGKSMLVDPNLFDQPEHYAKIMGYDKPIDFKLHVTPGEEIEINKKNP